MNYCELNYQLTYSMYHMFYLLSIRQNYDIKDLPLGGATVSPLGGSLHE